ncbi:hypothetical protein IJ117_02710 [Candidatus Saccharibacteria bacterium]|nr:hypothetical protein [Candidatus Saccharibacteria bacterium]
MPAKELERRKVELERRLKYLRKKVDKPVTTIGLKPTGKIILYRNRVENDEYSFKLDEDVTIEYYQHRNFVLGEVYYVLSIYCHDKVMSSPQISNFMAAGVTACSFFRKMFIKTQNEYIKYKDTIDREYVEFDKLETELKEIKDKLERDDVVKESDKRLRKMQRFFGRNGENR